MRDSGPSCELVNFLPAPELTTVDANRRGKAEFGARVPARQAFGVNAKEARDCGVGREAFPGGIIGGHGVLRFVAEHSI